MRVVAPAVSSAGATDPRSDSVAANKSIQPLRKVCGRAQTNTVLILVPTSDWNQRRWSKRRHIGRSGRWRRLGGGCNQIDEWIAVHVFHQSMRGVAPAVSGAGATDPRSDCVATNKSIQPLRQICGGAKTNTVLILVPTSD